ncbi:MAG: hypothetical protein L0387_44125 [Acidobacteria bacterium]|nr:hypothetical protein [Acidobacteriota bacterium]
MKRARRKKLKTLVVGSEAVKDIRAGVLEDRLEVVETNLEEVLARGCENDETIADLICRVDQLRKDVSALTARVLPLWIPRTIYYPPILQSNSEPE